MAKVIWILATCLFYTVVNGVPKDVKQLFAPNPFLKRHNSSAEAVLPKLDNDPNNKNTPKHHITADVTENNRQKRMYNYLPPYPSSGPQYQFPSPMIQESTYNNPAYNYPDPYQQIYDKVQQISSTIRQGPLARPIPNWPIQPLSPIYSPSGVQPIFVPVFYIPSPNCNCGQSTNSTNPGVDIRFPVMEDTNQNWGLVINETIVEEGDGSRPLSFEPIRPNRPISRPPPAVEHGSSQAGEEAMATTTTTARPLPPLTSLPPVNNLPGTLGTTTISPPAATQATEPTVCDGAVLTCCHQRLELTQNCIVAQGCPELLRYRNPCDSRLIFDVIQKFSAYYRRRLGQPLNGLSKNISDHRTLPIDDSNIMRQIYYYQHGKL